MDLKGWEIFTKTGLPVVGATVEVFAATDAHPNPGSALSSVFTDPNGMWQFTGLVDGEKDVRVTYQTAVKWYKGRSWVSVGRVLQGEPVYRPISRNSNFDHWQRDPAGAGRTHTTTYSSDTSYNADGFFVLPAGASVTSQRSTTVPANGRSQYSLGIAGAASVTTVDIGQRYRGETMQTRGKRMLIISCEIRNETGASFQPEFRLGTPGALNNFGTVTNRQNVTLGQCPDSAWTRVFTYLDVSGYTNINNGLEILLRVPSGVLVAGKTVRVAQFDVRPGSYLTAFEPEDIDAEFARLSQWYKRFTPDAGAQLSLTTGYAFTTSLAITVFSYGGAMWKIPVAAVSAVGHFGVPPSGGVISTIGASVGNAACRFDITMTTAALALSMPYNLQMNSASAYIELRAEL